MKTLSIYLILFILTSIFAAISGHTTPQFQIFSAAAIGFLLPLIDKAITQFRYYRFAWYIISNSNRTIRISISYLYRIKIDNAYLLIKGKRFNQYQPVGGVYKYHPSAKGVIQKYNILDDNLLTPDPISENDLRIRVHARRLIAVINWFESAQNRETDGWREFYEELIETRILPERIFKLIKYDHVCRYYHPLRYSKWAKSKELLIADIFELIPNEEQIKALKNLKNTDDTRIIWATEDQIKQRGAVTGHKTQPINIAETAEWMIGL